MHLLHMVIEGRIRKFPAGEEEDASPIVERRQHGGIVDERVDGRQCHKFPAKLAAKPCRCGLEDVLAAGRIVVEFVKKAFTDHVLRLTEYENRIFCVKCVDVFPYIVFEQPGDNVAAEFLFMLQIIHLLL